MNFATLKSLTIPEGAVTQIADASGNVLWSAVKTISVRVYQDSRGYAQAVMNGETYGSAGVYGTTYVSLPIGAVVTLNFKRDSDYSGSIYGVYIYKSAGSATSVSTTSPYSYTINEKTTAILLKAQKYTDDKEDEDFYGGFIQILEYE